MPSYVLVFRGRKDRNATSEEEAAWGRWFEAIGPSISDFGNRVGATSRVGNGSSEDVLTGYIVVTAESIEDAAVLAKGCPGLGQGGGVEVGELVAM